MTEKDNNANDARTILKDEWSIRPCAVYKDEYDDCTSFKARFHQYFINGKNTDCTQWQTDYKNCMRYRDSNGNNVEAGIAVIKSEEERRLKRFHGHYANNVWEKRKSPPADWSKPLPEWMEKKNENSYLQLKQLELEGKVPAQDEKSYCLIM
ncbi:synaptic plasticity regulator PANTS [Cochliomyia hominivorax]